MDDISVDHADHPRPTIALALGAGGARGLAHIAVLEAFDDLGIKPTMIAGASIGAVIGAAYAAGVSARQIRSHAERLLRDRSTVMAALVGARTGRLTDLIARGNPFLIDAERFLDRLWPNIIPERFEDLELPLLAVATDYSARTEAVFHKGRLLRAVADSMAIPGLVKPVRHGGHLLVDGGAVNQLPFDHQIGRADLLVAVDVTGGPSPQPTHTPGGFATSWETTIGTYPAS